MALLHDRPSPVRPQWWITQRNWLVSAVCTLAAALFTAVELTGVEEPVRMPTAPHLVSIIAAIGAALLVAPAGRVSLPVRARLGASVVCGAGMLAGSLLAIPHTALILIIWGASRFTGGVGPFDVTPEWLTTAAHLTAVVAVLLLAAWTVLDRRQHRRRCLACGRAEAEPGATGGPVLPWLAALTVAGSLPYGLLKVAWALGWTGGLTGHAFSDVSFTSPGFGDTAVLTTISVVTAVSMGARVSGRWARPVLTAVGVIGSFMLLPVAVMGVVGMVPIALGLQPIDESEIAAWAFLLVYSSFLVWGVALAALTIGYWRTTRGVCRRHSSAPVEPRPGSATTP